MTFQDDVIRGLEQAITTYKDRNAVYKDNFRVVGDVVEALFPNGVELQTREDFTRWHIFELLIVKLTRYAANYPEGGHPDSLADMIVYLGILNGIDGEIRVRVENLETEEGIAGTN